MIARASLIGLAAALLVAAAAHAQTDIQQLQPGEPASGVRTDQLGATDRRDAEELDQLAPGAVGDRTRVESIGPSGQTGVGIEQPEGRDLCDPSVPESVRRRAGVDCERELSVNGGLETEPLTETPGVGSGDEDLERTLRDLGLDEDVPPSVILQQ